MVDIKPWTHAEHVNPMPHGGFDVAYHIPILDHPAKEPTHAVSPSCCSLTTGLWKWRNKRIPFWAMCFTVRPDASPLRSSRVHLRQCRLGLWEPEGHLHTSIHLNRHRQLGTGLLSLAERGIQRAEAAVAVRLERAHAQLLGQGEGLAVVAGGGLKLWGHLGRRALA